MVEHVAEPLGGMVWTMGDGRIMQNLWEETLGDMSKHVKTQQHHGRLIFLVVHGVFCLVGEARSDVFLSFDRSKSGPTQFHQRADFRHRDEIEAGQTV